MHNILNDVLDSEEDKYEEEWEVIVADTKARYSLSKNQAIYLKEAISRGEKAVIFESFTIFIPFIIEFYRKRRYLKEAKTLPAKATERPYVPMSPEKFAEFKKKIYDKIGKASG